MAVHERNGALHIWWFPKEFSQSRFGEFRQSGTNSCTLISLLLANKVSKLSHGFHRNLTDLPRRAVEIFGAAINEGNGAYNRFISSRVKNKTQPKNEKPSPSSNQNLNIPDAMSVLKDSPDFKLQEWFYTHLQTKPAQETVRDIATRLVQIMTIGVDLYHQPETNEPTKYLFAALIADNRTVLFIFEFPAKVVTFLDSHQHGRGSGAVIAQCKYNDVYEMAHWFVTMLRDIYASQPKIYEISFLTTEPNSLAPPIRLHANKLKSK